MSKVHLILPNSPHKCNTRPTVTGIATGIKLVIDASCTARRPNQPATASQVKAQLLWPSKVLTLKPLLRQAILPPHQMLANRNESFVSTRAASVKSWICRHGGWPRRSMGARGLGSHTRGSGAPTLPVLQARLEVTPLFRTRPYIYPIVDETTRLVDDVERVHGHSACREVFCASAPGAAGLPSILTVAK